MASQTILRINASSLVLSRCTLAWYRTVVEGYKQPMHKSNLVYGIAGHKYIDTMFKTDGRIDLARDAALVEFNKPKYDSKTALHLSDANHFLGTCYSLWENYIAKDNDFEIFKLPPDGKPATEVTFSIKYYEDADFLVYLEGTIDKIGKIHNGCYAIGDYKFTSSWSAAEYLSDFEMEAQLKFYVLSLKLMAQKYPDSMLGTIGATRVGAFIDAIFLKPKACNNTYARSDVFQWSDAQLDMFRLCLSNAIERLMVAIRTNQWHLKEGMINGSCNNANKFSKCNFYLPCRSGKPDIEETMLKRDFIQQTYDPLHHNE